MKKVLVLGSAHWNFVVEMMLAKFAPETEFKVVYCEYQGDLFSGNGKWIEDPLDAFLELEPDYVFLHYEPVNEEKGPWWKVWKEVVSCATPTQKIYRFGWMQRRSTNWVAESNIVRARGSEEVVTDYIRLPLGPDEFRKLVQE